MGAATAALSVVGGVVGLGQQRESANAQKRAIQAQSQQAALQAQLQLMALKQQTYADTLNDTISDATRLLQYQQANTQLEAQQAFNSIASANALFESSVQRAASEIQQIQGNNEAALQKSASDEQAGQAQLAAYGQANEQQNSIVSAIGQLLGESGQRQNTVANLLDMAASSGGINEALGLLLGNSSDEVQAAFNLNRGSQMQDTQMNTADDLAAANRGVSEGNYQGALLNNAIQGTQTRYGADQQAIDATFSKQVADLGFESAKLANTTNFNIGTISDASSRFSRDYLRRNNESALLQGANLQQDILKAQADQVRTPGFFDYLNVGLGGYNTYRQYQQYSR